MKRAGWTALVLLVCTPMVLSLALLLMVQWPKMDGLTQKASPGIRTLVANGILNFRGADKAQQTRAGLLDANALKTWTATRAWRRRHNATNHASGGGAFPDQQAMYAQQKQDKGKAISLERQAAVELQQGQACAAEKLYAEADSMDKGMEVYQPLDGLGQAATRCGDLVKARLALEEVVQKEDDFLKDTDEDALTDMRKARMRDLQFLNVVYERQHATALQASVCRRLDAQWSSCSCQLTAEGTKCSGTAR